MAPITEAELKFFEENGYLLLENFCSKDECNQLVERMKVIVEEFEPKNTAIFSTKNQKQLTNNYFLESGRKVSFFFEEKAFDENGNVIKPKELSINKVGHALHDLDVVFRSFSRSEKISEVLASLGYKSPVPVQSMYIFKQPGIGGEVVPHQDSSFLYTEPLSCTGIWLALQDATEENGCLWALPGSHKEGISRRFHLDGEDGVTFDKDPPTYDFSKFVPLPAKAGTAVIIHGSLVHNSYENKSEKPRHAYTMHVVEGEGCHYAADNWLQKREGDPEFEPIFGAKVDANSHVVPTVI